MDICTNEYSDGHTNKQMEKRIDRWKIKWTDCRMEGHKTRFVEAYYLVQMEVESLELCDIIPYPWIQHQIKEPK